MTMLVKKRGAGWRPFDVALLAGAGEVVPTHHALDTSFGVHNPLFTCPERVTLAADFSPQIFFGRTDFPRITACTRYCGIFVVGRVNVGFHICF